MKFISKNINLRVILKCGIPADALGHSSIPALSVRFEDGMVETHDPEIIKLMLMPEKGFGSDYISGENDLIDPYLRSGSEPEHDMLSIENGRVAKNLNAKPAVPLSPEIKKAIENMAFESAKEMATKMAAGMIADFIKKQQSGTSVEAEEVSEAVNGAADESVPETSEEIVEAPVKKAGRPAKK